MIIKMILLKKRFIYVIEIDLHVWDISQTIFTMERSALLFDHTHSPSFSDEGPLLLTVCWLFENQGFKGLDRTSCHLWISSVIIHMYLFPKFVKTGLQTEVQTLDQYIRQYPQAFFLIFLDGMVLTLIFSYELPIEAFTLYTWLWKSDENRICQRHHWGQFSGNQQLN